MSDHDEDETFEYPEDPIAIRERAYRQNATAVLDSLTTEDGAAVGRTAIAFGLRDDDPLWPILRSLIQSSGDVDKAGQRLDLMLGRRVDELGLMGGKVGDAAAAKIGDAARQSTAEVLSASDGVVRAMTTAQARIDDLLEAAGRVEAAEIAAEFGRTASQAVERRLRAAGAMRYTTSFAIVTTILAVVLALGAGVGLGAAWAMRRIAPYPIQSCYAPPGHEPYCIIDPTKGGPYIPLPS